MIKISADAARQAMDEDDLMTLEEELYRCKNSDNREGPQTEKYFLLDESTIILQIFWGSEQVNTVSFTNRAELSECDKARLSAQEREISKDYEAISDKGAQIFILNNISYAIREDHYIDEDRTNDGIKPVYRASALSEHGDEVVFTFETVEGFELLEDAADHVDDWENFLYVKNIDGETIYHRYENELHELKKLKIRGL